MGLDLKRKERYHVKIHELEEWYHRRKFDLKKTHFREEIQNTKKKRKKDGHQKYSGP